MRALVVEDEADSRDLLVASLTRYGAEVIAVSSCAEALEQLESAGARDIHVLVSDIGMPQHDGYELMRRVRALEEHRAGVIPAIAVTGYATEDDRGRALAAGFQGHVAKPIDPASVVVAVRRAMQDVSRRNA